MKTGPFLIPSGSQTIMRRRPGTTVEEEHDVKGFKLIANVAIKNYVKNYYQLNMKQNKRQLYETTAQRRKEMKERKKKRNRKQAETRGTFLLNSAEGAFK